MQILHRVRGEWEKCQLPITRKFGKNSSDSEGLPILKGRGQLYRIADIFCAFTPLIGGRWGEREKKI